MMILKWFILFSLWCNRLDSLRTSWFPSILASWGGRILLWRKIRALLLQVLPIAVMIRGGMGSGGVRALRTLAEMIVVVLGRRWVDRQEACQTGWCLRFISILQIGLALAVISRGSRGGGGRRRGWLGGNGSLSILWRLWIARQRRRGLYKAFGRCFYAVPYYCYAQLYAYAGALISTIW